MKLIGISGKAGAGKDEVAKMLQHLLHRPDVSYETFKTLIHSREYQIKKFADKLKDIVCLLLNCTREQLEDREFKEKELGEEWWVFKFPNNQISTYKKDVPDFWQKYLIKLTPRLLLQLLGTECGRQIIHPNIWVNSLFADFAVDSKWIISDLRFPNEFNAIKERGGIIFRVNRKGFENTGNHESETALDNHVFDYTIENNSSLEQLKRDVRELLNVINLQKNFKK